MLDRSESGRIFLKQVTVTTSTGAGPSHGLWPRCPAGALVPQAYWLRRHIGDPDRLTGLLEVRRHKLANRARVLSRGSCLAK